MCPSPQESNYPFGLDKLDVPAPEILSGPEEFKFGLDEIPIPESVEQYPEQIGGGIYLPDERRIAIPFSQASPDLQMSEIDRAIDQINPKPQDIDTQHLWGYLGDKEKVAGEVTRQITEGERPEDYIDLNPFEQLGEIERASGIEYNDAAKLTQLAISGLGAVGKIPVAGEIAASGSLQATESYLRAVRLWGLADPTESIEALVEAQRPYQDKLESYGPVRRAITEAATQVVASLERGLPGMVAGAAAGMGAGSIPMAVTGYATNAALIIGSAEIDQFLEEAEKAGVRREDVMTQAVISGITEGGMEWVQDMTAARVLKLLGPMGAAAKESLMKSAGKIFGRVLTVSQVEGIGEAATAEIQSKLRRDVKLPAPEPGEAAPRAYTIGALMGLFFAPLGIKAADIRARETNKRIQDEKAGDWVYTKGTKPGEIGNSYIITKKGAFYQGKEKVDELQKIYDIKDNELWYHGQMLGPEGEAPVPKGKPKPKPAPEKTFEQAIATKDKEAIRKHLAKLSLEELQTYKPGSVFAATRRAGIKAGYKRSEIDKQIQKFAGRYTKLWEEAVGRQKGEIALSAKKEIPIQPKIQVRFEGMQEVPGGRPTPLFTVMEGKNKGSTLSAEALAEAGITAPVLGAQTQPGKLIMTEIEGEPAATYKPPVKVLTPRQTSDRQEIIRKFPGWLKEAGFEKVAERIKLRVEDFIQLSPEMEKSIKAHEARGIKVKPELIRGATKVLETTAIIQLASKTDNIAGMEESTYHELYHIAEYTLLSDEDYAYMKQEIPNQEDRADMFAEYVLDNRSHQDLPTQVRAWWKKLYNLLNKIGSWFKGQGFHSPEDIFGQIKSGKLAKKVPPLKTPQPKPIRGVALSVKRDYERTATKYTQDIPKGLRAKYTKYIGQPLWDYLSGDLPQIIGDRFMFVDAVNRGIITDYKKDPKFIELRDTTNLKISQARQYAKELSENLANMTKAEQVRAAQIIKGSVTTRSEKYNAAIRAHEAFDRTLEGLRELGVMGPDNRFDKLNRAELAKKRAELDSLDKQIAKKVKDLQPIIKMKETIRKAATDVSEKLISKSETEREADGTYKTEVSKWTKLNEDRVREALTTRGFATGEVDQMINRIKESVVPLEGKTGKIGVIRETLEKTITTTITREIQKTKTYSRSAMARARGSIQRDIKKLVLERRDIIKRIWQHDHESHKNYLRRAYRYIEEEKTFQRRLINWLRMKRPRLIKGYEKQRKDISDAYRAELGEIKEAPYLVMKGLSHETHDMMLMRMFHAIAANKDWTISAENYAKLGDKEKENYKPLPDNKRLGPLAGMMVDKYIWDDLNESVKQAGELERSYDKLLRLWKTGKVVFNPATQARNFMSNMILADWAGLPFHRVDIYIKAAKELRSKGDIYKEAKGSGLLGTEWAGTEIMQFLNAAADLKEGSMITNAGMLTKKILDKPGNWYQGIEQYFKLAVFMNERNKGTSISAAKDHAEKHIFNYLKIPPAIRWAKKWYSPFITFSYKAIPLFVETLTTKPWKIGKLLILMRIVEDIGRWLLGDTKDDTDREERILPEYMRKAIFPGRISHVRLPYKDQYNRSKWLDLSYILPWGDVAEQWGQSNLVGRPFLPTHPLYVTVAEIAFNRVLFTGRDLTIKDLDEGADYWKKIGGEIWRQAVPSLVGGFGYNKLMSAITGSKDWLGRDHSVPEAVFDTLLGLKIRSIDYTEQYERRLREYQKLIATARREYSYDYRRLMMNPPSDIEVYRKKQARLLEKANRKIQEIMDKITGLTDLRKD